MINQEEYSKTMKDNIFLNFSDKNVYNCGKKSAESRVITPKIAGMPWVTPGTSQSLHLYKMF